MKRYLITTIMITALLFCLCSCNVIKEEPKEAGQAILNENREKLCALWVFDDGIKSSSFEFREDGSGRAVNNEGKEISFRYTLISETEVEMVYDMDTENITEVSVYEFNREGNLVLDGLEMQKSEQVSG